MTNKTVSFDKPSGDDTVILEVSDTVDEKGDRVWRKAERYFVVSESELEHWADLNERLGECRTAEEVSRIKDEHIAAEAACRARPVESICAGTKDEIWVPTEEEKK